MTTTTKCRHDFRFLRTQRKDTARGEYRVINVERCERCCKTRFVNPETGRTISKG